MFRADVFAPLPPDTRLRMRPEKRYSPQAPATADQKTRPPTRGPSCLRSARAEVEYLLAQALGCNLFSVRVQRLNEIGEEDARAEGCQPSIVDGFVECGTRKTEFAKLWDSINAKRGFGWGSNPFVWALTFRRLP